MKSSDPVFTRSNPFPPDLHMARAHYNPSQAKKLSKQQKKLVLSPVRFDQLAKAPEPLSQTAGFSQEDQGFLEGSHHVFRCPPPSLKDQQLFSESWPSTDQTSSPASVANSSCTEPQASSADHAESSRTQESSVLAKYIERFRYGRPQSREERERLVGAGVDGHPLWLISSPQPSSSTPTQTSKECFRGSWEHRTHCIGGMRSPTEQSRANRSLSPPRGLLDLSALDLSESSHCGPGEPEILQLQERASRLLHKSENSSGSSCIPISSEGVGCTDFSSPISVDEPVRRPIMPNLMDTANLLSTPSVPGKGPLPANSILGTRGSHTRPEDDILFQWRLRRKMEQARQWSETSSHTTSFHQPLLSRMSQQPSPVSADQFQTVFSFTPAHVGRTGSVSTSATPVCQPAHPVFSKNVCTELQPETIKPSYKDYITFRPSSPIPQPVKESATVDHQGLYNLPQSHPNANGACSKHQTPSLQSQQPSQQTFGEQYEYQHREDKQAKGKLVVKRSKTKTAESSCKKKLDRHVGCADGIRSHHLDTKANSSHVGGQKRVSCKGKESRRENRKHNKVQSSGNGVLPPSPIHNTLGQVVSEVLFLGTDSPTQPTTPCFSESSKSTLCPHPQSPAPTLQNEPQTSEVIGQLLQEAQDSDGLEFEDDPLLSVLRQQREWVKVQLGEVDAMLDELNKD